MTLTIAHEFSLALTDYKAEEDSFKPLLEKFEELKKILQSNFLITIKERKWYGLSKMVTKPVLNIDIDEKITHSSGKYLAIRINGKSYVMGLGEIGELEGRLYFIEHSHYKSSHSRDKTIVYISSDMFSTYDYCLENKITNVQLFADLIKRYKQFLIAQ